MMLVGSMFSGLLGGLDIACERVFDAETAWQLDITGASVRRRHWPGVLQVEADVATVDPSGLPRVDVLCGGFPCQDLSTAGKQAGLDGARSGLYRHVLRFARVLEPQYIVLENVGGLLPYMPRLVADFQALGYGLTYAVCEAADVGLPHLRRRVFVVGERGVPGRGRVEVDRSRRWSAVESEREWPTATAGDVKASGSRCLPGSGATPGESLTDAIRTDRWSRDDLRLWATAAASNPNEGETLESWEARRLRVAEYSRPLSEPLWMQVREWNTVAAGDFLGAGPNQNTRTLGRDLVRVAPQVGGKRLNPAWVECLMGIPQGWTLPDGPSLRDRLDDWRAPRGRYPATWDRSVPWPGFAWEPSRTLPDGPPCPGRPARVRGLGNGVVWQQAEMGIGACVSEAGTGQLDLFAAVAR